MLTLRARSHAGGAESIILIMALGKGLVDTVFANSILVVIGGNVAVYGVLISVVIAVIIALSKGLVIAVVDNGILIVAVGNVTLFGIL